MSKSKKTKKKEQVIDSIYDIIGENDSNQGVDEYLTTGIMPLNYQLSGKYQNGGFGVGRIHEIFGPESSGKTLIATMAMIEAQRLNGKALFLDYEHSFSIDRAMSIGLNTGKKKNNWFYQQPTSAEKGFETIEKLANHMAKNAPETHICVVIDSIAAMRTEAELEAGFDSNMKTKLSLASCMSVSLKQLVPIVSSCKMTLIFLNQTRKNPGVTFGDPTALPGGESMKFYASTRTKLSKVEKIKDGDEIIAEKIVPTTIKNKIYKPFQKSEYISDFDIGVDLINTHLNDLVKKEFIEKSGSWYTFLGEKFQGLENVKKSIVENKLYDDMINLYNADLAA